MAHTIGKHLKGGRRKYDYESVCSYCGSAWLRSDLNVDAAGHYRCPQDSQGLDIVTLSEMNASALMRDFTPPETQDGLIQSVALKDKTNPIDIVGLDRSLAWWRNDNTIRVSDQSVYMPNQVVRQDRPDGNGDLQGVYDGVRAMPSQVNEQLTFDVGALRSRQSRLVVDGSNPTLWAVLSFPLDSQTANDAYAIDVLNNQYIADPYRLRIGKFKPGRVLGEEGYGTVGYKSSTVTVEVDPWPAGLQLCMLKAEHDQVVFKVGSTEYTGAIGSENNTVGDIGLVRMGLNHEGICDEVFLMSEIPTAAEITAMEAYFASRYPELSL